MNETYEKPMSEVGRMLVTFVGALLGAPRPLIPCRLALASSMNGCAWLSSMVSIPTVGQLISKAVPLPRTLRQYKLDHLMDL